MGTNILHDCWVLEHRSKERFGAIVDELSEFTGSVHGVLSLNKEFPDVDELRASIHDETRNTLLVANYGGLFWRNEPNRGLLERPELDLPNRKSTRILFTSCLATGNGQREFLSAATVKLPEDAIEDCYVPDDPWYPEKINPFVDWMRTNYMEY